MRLKVREVVERCQRIPHLAHQEFRSCLCGGGTGFRIRRPGIEPRLRRHYDRNPASGRILQKIGMTYEGRLRQQVKRWEVYEDLEDYGILKSEFQPGRTDPSNG